jgi:hypothetical protein
MLAGEAGGEQKSQAVLRLAGAFRRISDRAGARGMPFVAVCVFKGRLALARNARLVQRARANGVY